MKLPDDLVLLQGITDPIVVGTVVRYCAKICTGIEAAHWRTYKREPGPHAYDPHYQGLSDGAGECEQAILRAFELEAE